MRMIISMNRKAANKMIADGLIHVDPKICFGRPTVRTWTGLFKNHVPTEAIRDRLCAGKSISDISIDFCISHETIAVALRYELLCSSLARARKEKRDVVPFDPSD